MEVEKDIIFENCHSRKEGAKFITLLKYLA